MIQQAWYAVATSEEVTTQLSSITVHGRRFLLYRGGDSLVHVMDANCPHRGCDLTLGTVVDDHIQCPYHGWRFNTEGQCTHIPANPIGAFISPKISVAKYPTVEAMGLVWVYTSSKTGTVMPKSFSTFSEFENGEWVHLPFEVTWQAHFSRVVESVMDVSHLPFVHPEQAGEDVNPIVRDLECNVTKEGIIVYPTPFVPSHPMEPKPDSVPTERRTDIELRFPNQWMIRSPMGDESTMCTFLTFTPVDDETTTIYGIAMRDFEFDNDFLDEFHIEHTLFVMDQDRVIVESLSPRMAPFNLNDECHVTSDRPTILYRRMLKQALDGEEK